ncbi:transcription factor LHW-like [Papaver somniferum]|uniref:transcription factor LHW-like n=1 Tax=Papaver somniferum TaxID=3469 RepID=UPI000E6FFA44|nr:transcription factor LHW-like [Papaver somniferum]
MASFLKEALRCLCGDNQWSYAIFWKMGIHNPRLLVWEEFHYEPMGSSSLPGIESTDLLLKEWEGLLNSLENSNLPQLGCQTEDKVSLLMNKMMINNQINVVGQGIVGRAAFMGMHQWILRDNCMVEGYPSEVLVEVQHQFSAGMKTLAVIPVLPHGVVQLGSTLTVMENTGFVNDVKSLFAHLGSVPGALSSDTYNTKCPGLEFGPPALIGQPVSVDLSGYFSSPPTRSVPFMGAGFYHQNSTFQASRFGSQPSRSIPVQVESNSQLQPNSSQLAATTNTHRDSSQIKNPVVRQNNHLKKETETREIGAKVILCGTKASLNKQLTPNNSSTRPSPQFNESSSSSSNLTFIPHQQILPGVGLQEPVSNNLSSSTNNSNSQHGNNKGSIHNSLEDSFPKSLFGESKALDAGIDIPTLSSPPGYCPITYGSAKSTSHLKALQLNTSASDIAPVPSHQDWSSSSGTLPRVPTASRPSTSDNYNWNAGKQLIDNDLFQSLNILSSNPDECISRSSLVSNISHDRRASSTEHSNEIPGLCNTVYGDAHAQPPSGDGLFDILGIDLKSGKNFGSWEDSLTRVVDSNMYSARLDVSKCITQTDVISDIRAMNDEISESGIFSDTAPDHLLDAVVSKVHPGAKHIIDDDMSCWTTLTKISSSSVPSVSMSCTQVGVPDQNQGNIYGFSPSLPRSHIAGPSSFISGCSKTSVGEASQISSMYGSQTRLLVEDHQNVMCETSVSTAHSKKPQETGKTNRKRLRPGENPRPRPKDRQMIQDRVKELREIVPNGGKCSIDALLERTIKHMLFLQSVTKHANDLKQTGESKIISKDGGLRSKDSFEGGATWAFEVGSQSMVCPIIVEDLNLPRQMLVEMLCEEQGFFLEIADIIRGLGLTILKGVMEARNNKVWVRFTVEANRDVTRMEIFLALVHLLEQAVKGSTAAPKDVAAIKMVAHDPSHQSAIPATGQSNSLN